MNIFVFSACLLSLLHFTESNASTECTETECKIVCLGDVQEKSLSDCQKRCECDGTYDQMDDMKLDPSVKNLLIKSMHTDDKLMTKDAGAESYVLRWTYPGSSAQWKIPYYYGNVSGSMRTLISSAMTDYENSMCVQFVTRTTESSYIYFMDNGVNSCWSYVGRRSNGPNYINLHEEGCKSKGVILHEIMHAFGFFHEHQRPDRDDYVVVHWDEISPNLTSNFFKLSPEQADGNIIEAVPYDTGSVMHYSSFAFSANGSHTLTDLQGNALQTQQYKLADSDIQQLRLMYSCKGEVAAHASLTAIVVCLVFFNFIFKT